MKTKFLLRTFPIFLILIGINLFISCSEDTIVDPADNEPTTDQEALEQLVNEDSVISSFLPNFDEGGAMDILGKVDVAIYPFRVGHKLELVRKNLSIDIRDSIAYGTLTRTFNGTLFIAASYDPNALLPDTIITKPFTTTVTKNIIFKKIADTPYPMRNWIIAAVSLSEGKTQSDNIDLKKLTIFLDNGDTLSIESPTRYFINRRIDWWKKIPILNPGDSVLVRVDLTSLYEEDDLVTVTFGADLLGAHRLKKRFELISSTFNGTSYDKVYEQYFNALNYPGFYHAIFNTLSHPTLFDDTAPVEMESWGLPYFITP